MFMQRAHGDQTLGGKKLYTAYSTQYTHPDDKVFLAPCQCLGATLVVVQYECQGLFVQ